MDNGDSPVTRAELQAELKQLKIELKREILDGVQEVVRDSQTEILKAFLPFQEPTNIRFRALEAKVSNTDVGITERMAILERRLQEIEKRLLMNPPAA
ncbi:MAG TPA: hypothetical protein VMJ75_14570 [Candidatus Acidoferrales bacterium]|nr:hypothetical protein [Candidatus Acidoferrales bacterium]